MLRALRLLLLTGSAAILSGCGAGIITAVLAQSSGPDPVPAETTITLSQPQGPLSVEVDEFYVRRAVLRGAQIPLAAEFAVALVADFTGGTASDDQNLLVVERSGTDTTLTFAMRTDHLALASGDVTAADVAAQLVVTATDGQAVEVLRLSAPFRLLRKPTLNLVPNEPAEGISLVSVSGGEIEFSVTALPTIDPRDLVVEVVTEDPNPPAGQDPSIPAILLRRASNLRTEAVPGSADLTTVRATLPSSTFSTQAFARVVHNTAGRSTAVAGIYYRPELNAVVSRRGSTDGGEIVTLSGQGLVPLDFSVRPAVPEFGSVRVFLAKGGREVEIPTADLRPSLSSLNSLVWVTPPSPDGRPGPATIRLELSLPRQIEVTGDGLFAYGANQPDFGPRGVTLGDPGIAAAAFGGRVVSTDPTRPIDAAVVFADASGVPQVSLLESLGNGVFSRLGVQVPAGDRSDPNQRTPLDLVWGDFFGESLRSLIVVDRGSSRSTHAVLRGRDDPSAPFALTGVAFRSAVAPVRAHIGRFDDDARDDIVVVGGADANLTSNYAIADASGLFTARAVFDVAVPRVDVSAVADVDGDGHDDMLFANGLLGPTLRLQFGEPGSQFTDRRDVDLSAIPELAGVALAGLHVAGPGSDRTIVLVTRGSSTVAPSIVLLPAAASRTYGPNPIAVGLGLAGGVVDRTLTADLDADGLAELVLGRATAGLSLWAWQSDTFVELPGAVGLAAADTGTVRDLAAGPAVDATRGARPAVFVAHDVPSGTGTVARITTLLVGAGPRLLDPIAVRELGVRAHGVATGAFVPAGNGGDVLIASDGRLDVLANDGVGELAPVDLVAVAGLVPETVVAIAATPTATPTAAAFLTSDGRVGLYEAGATTPNLSTQPLFTGPGIVAAASRIVAGDADGDGRTDLVVLLLVDVQSPPSTTRSLVLLRGRDPTLDPFPFFVPPPAARLAIPEAAVDVALGDLAADADTRRLEVVLAVGRDDAARGLHFYHLQPGTTDDTWHYVESVIDPNDQRVAAGIDPRLVLASDLEGDGLADLLVVSGSLDSVQLFRQTGPSIRDPDPGIVDPRVFASAAERALPAGLPVAARLVDVDGDRLDDLLVQVRLRSNPEQHAIAVAISSGLAGFADGFELAAPQIGASGPDLAMVGSDLNGDTITDLVLAWSGDGGSTPAQVRVLFGSRR